MRQLISNGQHGLFTLKSYQPGEVIADFSAGTSSAEPTYLTVQIDAGKHITLQPDFLQYINHSCEPNVFFNTTTMKLIALKELNPQDELVFFYPSTEWKMNQPLIAIAAMPVAREKSAAGPTYLKRQGKNISLLILFNNSWQSKMPGKK